MSPFPTYATTTAGTAEEVQNGLLDVKSEQLFLFIHLFNTYWVPTMYQALF